MDLSQFEKGKTLSTLTTFGIGGKAQFYIEVTQIEQMQQILSFCHHEALPFFILGKGSNVIFDDRGFRGVVIANRIHFLEHLSGRFKAGAGYSFSLLGTQTARQGWEGLEFASGIPGSVGGAVYMNAGANGSETVDVLDEIEFIDHQGCFHRYKKESLEFGYRKSPFQNMSGAIVSATFHLKPSVTARKKQLDIIQYRQKTQPYSDKSAGCIFRNPTHISAGALIDQCGLKGLQVGNAKVSTMHANFIVSNGKASAAEVLELIEQVRHKVKELTGQDLESEVRYIPYE